MNDLVKNYRVQPTHWLITQVLLLDDLFERCAAADEDISMNYVRKHALKLESQGSERPAARLFSNPAGDYGSMVNERVGSGDLCRN